MSAIRRGARPADRFTMISNEFHRDHRLSFAARGLGGWLMSHVEGWESNTWTIARENGIGRDQVRRLLRELEEFGYLRRIRVRGEGGRLGGTVHEIQCTPWTDKTQKPSSDHGLEDQALEDQALVSPPHKKNSSKNNIPREDHPSGGDGSAAPAMPAATVEEDPAAPEEEPMPTATDPAQAQLFDVEAPEPPAAEARRSEGAQAVVAAYVESWRDNHAEGEEPLRADKGRIARDAKAMLAKGEATEEELTAAARELGRTTWANIGTQVNIIRRRSSVRGRGNAPARRADDPGWEQRDRDQDRRLPQVASDPAVLSLRARYLQEGAA